MMECDSMHSAIEHQKKYMSVYTMHDWINIFRLTCSKRNRKNAAPYNVQELKYSDFINLNALSKDILKNKTKDSDGNKVNWLKVKCFRFEKMSPGVLKYRYDHSSPYSEINVFGRRRPKRYTILL